MNNSELDDKLLFELENFDINDDDIDSEIDLNHLKRLTKKILNNEITYGGGGDNYDRYEKMLEEVFEDDNF